MSNTVPDTIPKPHAETKKSSAWLIWLIPLITALLGLWLVYDSYSEQGILVSIRFETASGIAAGKTQIRYKGVEMGVVESLRLTGDLTGVVVMARINKDMKRHLGHESQFWVVKPRIGAQGISGLNTLVSGAYITVDPDNDGEFSSSFVGLEQPPLTPNDTPGVWVVLDAAEGVTVNVGVPVYFHNIEAGTVEAQRISDDGQRVEYDVFIREPFDQQVTTMTRFWNITGININVGSGGFDVQTGSLDAILTGGIAFDNQGKGDGIESGQRYRLYADTRAIEAERYVGGNPYVVIFEESVKGLAPGAPVEFKGIQIGTVTDIRLEYDLDTHEVVIPVWIDIQQQLLTGDTGSDASFAAVVRRGLSAKLQSGSLITGSLFVELGMFSAPDTVALQDTDRGMQLPSVPGEFTELSASVNEIIAKIKRLPLEELVGNAAETMDGLAKFTQSDGFQALPADVDGALVQVEKTLAEVEQALAGISEESPLYGELSLTAKELTEAARAVRELADSLDDKPNSLIFGK